MKRRKSRPSRQKTPQPANPPAKSKMSRRDMLGLAKFFAIGGAVVLGGGYYFVDNVMAGIEEADLSKLGNGLPTIVQIHDPQCPSCRTLQQTTRAVLDRFEDGEIQYLVANLASPDGRRFAEKHRVGRVTLLLFDGRGHARGVIQGVQSEEALTEAFRRHLRVSRGTG